RRAAGPLLKLAQQAGQQIARGSDQFLQGEEERELLAAMVGGAVDRRLQPGQIQGLAKPRPAYQAHAVAALRRVGQVANAEVAVEAAPVGIPAVTVLA